MATRARPSEIDSASSASVTPGEMTLIRQFGIHHPRFDRGDAHHLSAEFARDSRPG
jgi:hypothetical protein